MAALLPIADLLEPGPPGCPAASAEAPPGLSGSVESPAGPPVVGSRPEKAKVEAGATTDACLEAIRRRAATEPRSTADVLAADEAAAMMPASGGAGAAESPRPPPPEAALGVAAGPALAVPWGAPPAALAGAPPAASVEVAGVRSEALTGAGPARTRLPLRGPGVPRLSRRAVVRRKAARRSAAAAALDASRSARAVGSPPRALSPAAPVVARLARTREEEREATRGARCSLSRRRRGGSEAAGAGRRPAAAASSARRPSARWKAGKSRWVAGAEEAGLERGDQAGKAGVPGGPPGPRASEAQRSTAAARSFGTSPASVARARSLKRGIRRGGCGDV